MQTGINHEGFAETPEEHVGLPDWNIEVGPNGNLRWSDSLASGQLERNKKLCPSQAIIKPGEGGRAAGIRTPNTSV